MRFLRRRKNNTSKPRSKYFPTKNDNRGYYENSGLALKTDTFSKLRWRIILHNLQMARERSLSIIDQKLIGEQEFRPEYTKMKVKLLRNYKIISNFCKIIFDEQMIGIETCYLYITCDSFHIDDVKEVAKTIKDCQDIMNVSVLANTIMDNKIFVEIKYIDETHKNFILRQFSENNRFDNIEIIDVIKPVIFKDKFPMMY